MIVNFLIKNKIKLNNVFNEKPIAKLSLLHY